MTDSDFCAECKKRAEKIGRPDTFQYVQDAFDALQELACSNKDFDAMRKARVAAQTCLWERHLREWAKQQGFDVRWNPVTGDYCLVDFIRVVTDKNCPRATHHPDYHTALLAAVDALEEKR